jgi:hypothetical protein
MPSAKSGSAGTPVSPVDPTEALDADDADPGAVEEAKQLEKQTGTGKYGTVQTQPFKKDDDSDSDPTNTDSQQTKTSWIEIVLIDEDNNPVPGEHYQVTLPDDTVAEGTLDQNGFARIEGIPSGTCKITFPDLDKDSWQPA